MNGEPRALRDGSTVSDLVAELGLDGRSIAVELNRMVVPKEEFPRRTIGDGDQLEVVEFVGGG